MAARRVWSKKGKITLIFSIIIGVLVTSGSGYLLWRVNRNETLGTVFIEAWRDPIGDPDVGVDHSYWDSTVNSNISAHKTSSSQSVPTTSSTSTLNAAKAADKAPSGYYTGFAYNKDSGEYETIQVKIGTSKVSTPAPAKTSSSTPIPAPASSTPTAPAEDPNVCDGGAWVESPPETISSGEEFTISGYGQDSDGVDPTSVSIAVDGETVDNVSASVSITDTTKTDWEHTISGLEEGEHTVTITWKDNEGLGGSDCTLTSSFSIEEIPTNPDWEIEKVGTPVLKEGATDDLDEVEIVYVITITNTGDGEGVVENVVDTLDDKVEDTFLVTESITNGGEYSEGVITWNLTGVDASFDSAESKIYQYKLIIPRVSFGTYGNTAVATPTEGDPFSVSINVQTSGNLVQTGLLDEVSRKIVVGFSFLAVGVLYMKFDFVKFAWSGIEGGKTEIVKGIRKSKKKKVFSLRKRFEKRIVKNK